MLALKHNDITVTPMRPEYSAKSFSSNDVPHGTDSVYYKAAMVLNQNHAANIGLPQFTADQIVSMNAAKQALITVVDFTEVDEDGNLVNDRMTVDMSLKVEAASTEELQIELNLMVSDPMSMNQQVPKYAFARTKSEGMMGQQVPLSAEELADAQEPFVAQAKAVVETAKKADLAKHLVQRDIDQCLVVPTITAEFKALFTEIEIPA